MFFSTSPLDLLVLLVTLLVSISFHEAAHAFVAVKLGDDTPKYQGRLTLNPLAHLDLFGSIAFLLVGFGWGKPVQVNAHNFENSRKDMMFVALAGPMANFFLAFCAVGIFAFLSFLSPEYFYSSTGAGIFSGKLLANALSLFAQINVFLGVFNLLPFPPLDGGSVLFGILPEKIAPVVREFLVVHGQIVFFILLGVDLFLHIPIITGPVYFLSQYILTLFAAVFAF